MKTSHFFYDARKRSAIIGLSAIILGMVAFLFWWEPVENVDISDTEWREVALFEKQIDSLRQVKIAASAPKIYPFNPNYLTNYRGYRLGMSIEEMDRLLRFRESGKKWINSAADFQRVTGVSDSLLATISPYFKFPEWVTNPKPKGIYKNTYPPKKSKEEKKGLNEITKAALIAYEGVDEILAGKVLRYKDQLGGFLVDDQLYEVWDLPRATVRALLNDYTVKNPPAVKKMNINEATASDLHTFPFLSWDLSKEIVDYRTLREGVQSFDELKDLEGMTERKLARIKLYLYIE